MDTDVVVVANIVTCDVCGLTFGYSNLLACYFVDECFQPL